MPDAWIYTSDGGPAADVARTLAELGYRPRQTESGTSLVPSGADGVIARRPRLAVVVGAAGEPAPVEFLRRLREDEELGHVPVVVSLDAEHLHDAEQFAEAHELLVRPFSPAELAVRIARAQRDAAGVRNGELIQAGAIELNLATYQASVEGMSISLTYMEYELLRFLMTHANRVFTREGLLSAVWGYDYYGGARTVDVHVRRVRAKLGPENAARVKTIRSVGYRFET
jgi:DNA-binding response OmpR family regulator